MIYKATLLLGNIASDKAGRQYIWADELKSKTDVHGKKVTNPASFILYGAKEKAISQSVLEAVVKYSDTSSIIIEKIDDGSIPELLAALEVKSIDQLPELPAIERDAEIVEARKQMLAKQRAARINAMTSSTGVEDLVL